MRKRSQWAWKYLTVMAQRQNLFAPGSVLIAETQLLLFWPFVTYLWSGFFSWTSIWNFDLAFRPVRKPAPPVGSCLSHLGKRLSPPPASAELSPQMSLSSCLPRAQPHSHLPGWRPSAVMLKSPLSAPGTEILPSTLVHPDLPASLISL